MANTDLDASLDPEETQEIELEADEAPTEIVSDDGSITTLVLDENEPATAADTEWFANLAETLPQDVLDALAQEYLDLIDDDTEARKERDDLQAAGLKKAGIGGPAPGGAEFEGASRVTHPVLTESYIDFSASAIKELFPPNGPVRSKIEGKQNKEKLDKAERKTAFMNWQLTEEIKSYRSELERLLTQLPVGGSQFMKLYWNESLGRPSAEFVPIDDIVLPYEAKNFFDCQRKFHRMRVSDFEYQRKVQSGVYIDDSLSTSYADTENETASARATARIEGKENDYAGDTNERLIYEGCIYHAIEGDTKAPEDRMPPYLITIDEQSKKVLALYRNWDEDDKSCTELEYLVDYTFIPWRGVFGLSLLQCLAGLPDALTGGLRAILDTALINNMAGGIKLKGAPNGASLSVAPTQIQEVDAMGTDDIRKVFMPVPFNPPSPVLFQLLGFLENAAKGVVSTAEEKIADAGNNMPVGTALALIEQGGKVFSAIHARLHDSQRRCLEILHRLNRDHLPAKLQFGSDPEDFVTPEDFEGRMDVHPVSDPNIFSEAQRFAQIQFVISTIQGLAQTNPAAVAGINYNKLLARAFKMAKIADYEDFLPPDEEPQPMNPVDENVNMVMGKPVKAFEGQNHEAHIQVLLDFARNPLFGASPVIAPSFITAAMNHLQDHLLVWYQETMKAAAQGEGQVRTIDWDEDPDSAVALASVCKVVDKAAEIAFAQIPGMVQQGMQQLQAMAPKPPVDPMVQIAQQEVLGRQQAAQAKTQMDAKEHQDDVSLKQQQQSIDALSKMGELVLKGEQQHTDALAAAQNAVLRSQTDLAGRLHDNHSETQRETLRSVTGLMNQNQNPTETESE